MSLARPATNRIASLDQFRGYTVAGMFLVNFIGSYAATPIIFTHKNTFCSYADTIMPQFFFAVGFAFRLTFGRRAQSEGLARAYGHVVRRLLGLALVALVVYGAPTVARTCTGPPRPKTSNTSRTRWPRPSSSAPPKMPIAKPKRGRAGRRAPRRRIGLSAARSIASTSIPREWSIPYTVEPDASVGANIAPQNSPGRER